MNKTLFIKKYILMLEKLKAQYSFIFNTIKFFATMFVIYHKNIKRTISKENAMKFTEEKCVSMDRIMD